MKKDRQYNDQKKKDRQCNDQKKDRQCNDQKKNRQYNDLKRRRTNKTNNNPGPKEEEHKQDKRQTIQ